MSYYIYCRYTDGRKLWVCPFKTGEQITVRTGIGLHLDINEAQIFTDTKEASKVVDTLNDGIAKYAQSLKLVLPFKMVIAERATEHWPQALKKFVG